MSLLTPLILALAALGHGAAVPEEDSNLAAVRAVLRRGPDDRRSSEQVLRELERLGPGSIPIFFGIATGSGLEGLFAGQSSARFPECSIVAPEEIVRLAQSALVRQPAARLLPFLEAELTDSAEAGSHLTILAILGARSSAEGLELYWRVLEELGDLALSQPRVRSGARDALAEILLADTTAWDRLERRRSRSGSRERELVADAIRQAGRPRGARALREWLADESDPAARRPLLAALAELEHRSPWELEGETLDAVRTTWRTLSGDERGELALALARTDDPAAAELLLELGEAGARPRRLAGAALNSLAKTSFESDPGAWRSWHEDELAWRDERWEELSDGLVDEDPALCVRALHELFAHPFFRRDAARLVAESLLDAPAPAAGETARVLVLFGSRAALPGLVNALDSGSPELRAHAARALRALTGEDRPAEAKAWRAGILD